MTPLKVMGRASSGIWTARNTEPKLMLGDKGPNGTDFYTAWLKYNLDFRSKGGNVVSR